MNATYRDDVLYADFSDTAWPALTWNNRPFVSQYELALVPGGSGRQLYGPHRPGVERPAGSPPMSTFEVLQNFTMPGAAYNPLTSSRHLVAFKDTGNNNLFNAFEFLEVPSRYVGTEFYLNPTVFDMDATPNQTKFNPPFNTISRYRNPGKININTVLNSQVWDAFIGDYGTMGTNLLPYNVLEAIRRGNGAFSDFEQPFRANGMGKYVPQDSTGNPIIVPSFEGQETVYSRQAFNYASDDSYNDTQRNAVFADGPLARFANIATNRSSVFAIWITVGYFEVDEAGLLGAEVVEDRTGQPKRPRGFFIYDRSIPVAFEPGNDHNVERGILVQTYFE
jgi:hypothetical protein